MITDTLMSTTILTRVRNKRLYRHAVADRALTELADPEFLSCRKVDLLLGAEVYSQIILEGLIHGPPRTPVAQATTLGWILTGPITDWGNLSSAKTAVTLQCSTDADISEILQRFWAIEEVSTPFTPLNDDEKACEEYFAQTHSHDDSGRYVVRLPFSRLKFSLGLSRATSEVLRKKLEKRFRNSSELETAYRQFMDEYESFDHMILATGDSRDISSHYYLPHHGVIRASSTTTKLRVVFNASCKTTSGLSLNDLVHKVVKDLEHKCLNGCLMRQCRSPLGTAREGMHSTGDLTLF